MIRTSRWIGLLVAALAILLLAACKMNGEDFQLSGQVTGLQGSGLVLVNDGEDRVSVAQNGGFEFSRSYPFAYPYLVTVGVQPENPPQSCAVDNAQGQLTKSVGSVRVSCINTYTVGGTVTGLTGTGLVLQYNTGDNQFSDNLTVNANGNFAFKLPLVDGTQFNVIVQTQPTGQRCAVAHPDGTLAGANATSVQVVCGTRTVGGTVTGFGGGALVLTNTVTEVVSSSEDLTITSNGSFVFPTALYQSAQYTVTVKSQPPGQVCRVDNSSGTIASADVTNVQVSCAYAVAVTVAGLQGSLILQNNGGDNLTISTNGAFNFATGLANGATYNVTTLSVPVGQSCTITGGSGTIASAAAAVGVTCRRGPAVTASYGVRQVILNWGAVSGTDFYRVFKTTDANFFNENVPVTPHFSQLGGDINTGTSYTDIVPVHLTDWVHTGYKVQACTNNSSGPICNDSNLVSPLDSAQATGYFKASNPGASDSFGYAVAVSGDGDTLAIGALFEDSAATGIDDTTIGQNDNSASNSGAVYVFTRGFNGQWGQRAYIKASNTGAQDNFGISLALSEDGTVLAVGASGESSAATGVDSTAPGQADNSAVGSGAAYVFVRTGSTWAQQAYIKASNTEAGDNFGYALALSQDGATLAVGAYFEDSAAAGIGGAQADNAATNSGAAYVFTRSGTTWSQQAYIKASNVEQNDQFGSALALSGDGDTLAIGARNEDSAASGIGGNQSDDTALDSGAVYVFTRDALTSVWTQQAYVKASNSGAGDLFGYTLALSGNGDTLAVGSIGEDSGTGGEDDECGTSSANCALDAGAAYIFARSGAAWAQQAYVKAPNAQAGDHFGAVVSLDEAGDMVAVGAPLEDSAANGINGISVDTDAAATDSGAVYVFTKNSSNTWLPRAYVKASNTGVQDGFGNAVALSANGATLAAGATLEDSASTGVNGNQGDDTISGSGAVYLY